MRHFSTKSHWKILICKHFDRRVMMDSSMFEGEEMRNKLEDDCRLFVRAGHFWSRNQPAAVWSDTTAVLLSFFQWPTPRHSHSRCWLGYLLIDGDTNCGFLTFYFHVKCWLCHCSAIRNNRNWIWSNKPSRKSFIGEHTMKILSPHRN